ncbi:MAG: AAA family ATPase [Sandaracinus sp.]
MSCPRCQRPNEAGAKFCEECAAPLARACASCGRSLSPTAKFCPECAHPVASTGATSTAPRYASPDAYTPKHLAEKILTSRTALEGERKQVTVLFADLKGSMELLAHRDPEDARAILDPVLERMMEAVHRYEGTVNQVMGDGIMALFGAPVAHEDHAVRACYAALEMQAAIRRYAEEVRRTHGFGALASRVGINSGEVVVRTISSGLRMDYSAIGQTTHLAARMEQLARPDTTLLTPATLRLAEHVVLVESLGPLPVKGLDAPLEVFQLLGAGAMRSRLQVTAARGLSRFVGRDAELEQLRQAADRARSGRGQVVAVVGEPGLGKSRLVWDLTHSLRAKGWTTLEASAVSYGKATPYLPIIGLLKAHFQIEDRDDHRAVREKVLDGLLSAGGALEGSLPALLALLDVPVEDAAWRDLDPPQRRQHILGALKRLLLRESQRSPLLVVFEDLHWIDTETQALLDGLVESLPTARLLLLVNYRPEYEHRWGGKSYYTQLRLDPLAPASAGELLQALLGPDPSLEPLAPLLIARTEGNPFFLEESVRDLVETGVLSGERGAHRLVAPLPGVQVPATVQAVLASRLDRLAPQEKRVLQEAGVIGKDVPLSLLRAVTELSESTLPSSLASLQAGEFLYETSVFPDIGYTFKHALTHEVAYGSVLSERRRALHARVVQAIERHHADRLAEHAEQLAHHAFRGGEWSKAASYFRQAGAKANLRSAHREAAASFEQAVAALAHCPESRETLEQAVDVRLELRNALYPLGEVDRIFEVLGEAERMAITLGDKRRHGWVVTYLGTHYFGAAQLERAAEVGQRALELAAATDDLALEVQASSRLGWVHYVLGAYPRAVELLDRSIAPLVGTRSTQRLGMPTLPSVMSRTYLSWSLSELGRFAEAATRATEALRIAESVGEAFSRVTACTALGSQRRSQGHLAEAIPLLERARTLCREANIVVWLSITASELGHAYSMSGRSEEGMALLELSVDGAPDPRNAQRCCWLGESYLRAGRASDASRTAERALALARSGGMRGDEAWSLRLLGEIAERAGPLEAEVAEGHYRQALALAEALSMRPLMAHCHAGMARLHRRTSEHGRAQEHSRLAAAMYREMEMIPSGPDSVSESATIRTAE